MPKDNKIKINTATNLALESNILQKCSACETIKVNKKHSLVKTYTLAFKAIEPNSNNNFLNSIEAINYVNTAVSRFNINCMC